MVWNINHTYVPEIFSEVASDLAVERAHGEVAAQVAKAKAAKAAKAPGSWDV